MIEKQVVCWAWCQLKLLLD